MKTLFKDLFKYNRATNSNVISRIPGDQVQCLKLFSHILNAHAIWNSRLAGAGTPPGVWQTHAANDLITMDERNFQDTMKLLDYFSPGETISYKNTKGASFTNTRRDILFHIINHTTHHRAQVISLLREAGVEMPVSDYIFYKRSAKQNII